MESFFERLIVRAATIDDILSDAFEPLPGQKGDVDLATRRLAEWCRSCASGDWSLFERRLKRDQLSIGDVLARFATVRRWPSVSTPAWVEDAIWIEAAMRAPGKNVKPAAAPDEPYPFEHLFTPVVEHAEALLWARSDARAFDNLNKSARACLRKLLLNELCGLSAPALYERFVEARKAGVPPANAAAPQRDSATSRYDCFIADMQAGGSRRLFEDKPVLLRLIALITRQWIDTSREFVARLDADLKTICRDILHSVPPGRVAWIEGHLSDPHNHGHSVLIVGFEHGARVVYKPKDLRLDAAWHALVEQLNRSGAPVDLKAMRAMARDGFGWTEFVDHAECADAEGCKRFYRREGAWLALFHFFAGTDMHQENMIAASDHPVPIDLEMILQATPEENKTNDPEEQAFEAAVETVGNSVIMVGLLPTYGKSPENKVIAVGGMTSDWTSMLTLAWNDINSDTMRPSKAKKVNKTKPNLPHIDGHYAKLGDYIDDFVSGFEEYARFLEHRSRDAAQGGLFDGFAGVPIRKVIRPTRFYYMLLQRMKNHRTMDDGILWSAQAEFVARFADWDQETDLLWPLQRAERLALIELNVPHFMSKSNGKEICDATGISARTEATSGVDRARARVRSFNEQDLAWQVDVIRQNTSLVLRSDGPTASGALHPLRADGAVVPGREIFIAEANSIATELAALAIRRGPGASWIGLDWLGDSEVAQLVALGPDLYNGVCGIAVFLAAHATVTKNKSSEELALAALAHVRKNLRSRSSARVARLLGTGGATGVGSIVYALAVTAQCLHHDDLLADADLAAQLISDDLIAADQQLDVVGGSAGAILGLLRLYRDTQSDDALKRALKCGEHLLAQPRVGPTGRRSWSGQGSDPPLNGMSHGAAGFAYALGSLAAVTGREEFATAAAECIAFENSSYNAERSNWPYLRGGEEPMWPCQWCHGAPGIGLARIALAKAGALDSKVLATDIHSALRGVERGRWKAVDTLCCGTLGGIEFLREAAGALRRGDLRDVASRRLTAVLETAVSIGDYRWGAGQKRFNLGLFRGLAGLGYTCLRQAEASLPNVLTWE